VSDNAEFCEPCGHLFDPHVLIATTGEPADGGVMFCPVEGCECVATWGMEGGPAKYVPSPEEIASLRMWVQRKVE
jgi:hypothetical protein